MPQTLTLEETLRLGIEFSGRRMDNGEHRFRLMSVGEDDGYGYILTTMPRAMSGWQNSHFHMGVMETYIVQQGWIGYADLMPDDTARFYVYRAGELFTTRPGQAHNVYMPAGAIIHTVKHGNCALGKDWHASPRLDALTRHVWEESLLFLAGLTPAEIAALALFDP